MSLSRLGIKTIVSVDGAKPDNDQAHRQGLQYIHVPIGYDGVGERARLALTRVARDVDRPIYVHCHHGRHRGPAATAIICIAAGETSARDAALILETAGTGKEYPGLWRDVAAFSPPTSGAALPELVEIAQVESLAAAMAGIDRHWDNLKLCQDAGWRTPRDHPDLSPAQEALLIREALHEAQRTARRARFDAQFTEWLQVAESLATRIEDELRCGKPDDASRNVQTLEQSCKACHVKYRN
jgi:rhodanese-related sulfurtransferase